jgi:F-type H+-transporting ATPase subunit epsilon
MENSLQVSIVTPNGEICNKKAKSIVLPGKDGEFGVLPNHSSLVSTLGIGVIEVTNLDATVEAIAINWGHVKVNENGVDVLVNGAVPLCAANESELAENIKAAKELVKSVEDPTSQLATVESKISSYKTC